MSAIIEPETKERASAAPEQDYSKLTRLQKLAALLVILGEESAAQVFKTFDPAEVDAVSAEMAKLDMVPQELQRHILEEFSEVTLVAGTSLRGGLTYTRTALEKSLGVFKATEIIGRVAPTRAPVTTMQGITGMDARQIFNLLRYEQAQTIALVLSYVTPDKAAQVSAMLRHDQRDEVLERLATLAPTPVEVVEKVVEVLTARLGVNNQNRNLNQTGGVKTAAAILNAMDKAQSRSLLLSIEQRNPDLTQAIRQKMFTFEDLATLDGPTLQRILREVDMRDLAVALKTASDKLKALLLASISKRAAESIQEEITFMGPIRLRDIESAQVRVIDIVRKLETDGEINLGEARKTFQYEPS